MGAQGNLVPRVGAPRTTQSPSASLTGGAASLEARPGTASPATPCLRASFPGSGGSGASQGRAFGDLGAWVPGLLRVPVRAATGASRQPVCVSVLPAPSQTPKSGAGVWEALGRRRSGAWLGALPLTVCKPAPLGLGASSVEWLLSKAPSSSETGSSPSAGR